jgi:DNA-directed RNA polymerase specialized sigma24 family protein
LDAPERRLLREVYVAGARMHELAERLGVHRATLARRLDRARAKLLASTRKDLAAALRLPRAEIDSIVRWLDTDLGVSIRKLLDSQR